MAKRKTPGLNTQSTADIAFLLLCFRKGFRIFEFGNNGYCEWHVMADSRCVVVNSCLKMLVVCFTD